MRTTYQSTDTGVIFQKRTVAMAMAVEGAPREREVGPSWEGEGGGRKSMN